MSVVPCVYLALKLHAGLARSEQYRGTVTAHIPVSGKTTTYALQITYQDRAGVSQTYTTSTSASSPERSLGDTITVFDDPSTSKRRVLTFSDTYLLYWLWFSFGIFAAGCVIARPILYFAYVR
jgi:hypothetical protein